MSAIRLSPVSLADYQAALQNAGVDDWLFYDFRGLNPVAGELLGVGGFVTCRFFVWVPAAGTPVAITHAIEQGVWSATGPRYGSASCTARGRRWNSTLVRSLPASGSRWSTR